MCYYNKKYLIFFDFYWKAGDFISGSIFGNIFKISTWGESHGKAVGVVIDGCPAGVLLNEDDIQKELDKRKPNQSEYTTKRNEDDLVNIMSGVFEGKTTGTPISLMVFNKDYKSNDYDNIKDVYRPSHADYTYSKKYDIRDYRGGGRSSGRETVGRVCAGAVAKKVLEELDINIISYVSSVGDIKVEEIDLDFISQNDFRVPCRRSLPNIKALLDETIKNQDSIGGTVYCEINGLKAGIGEPVFNKLDAILAQAMLSIGASKGIEFGAGFASTSMYGSSYNDEFYMNNSNISKHTNNSGGILGGISDGSKIYFNIAFKPTPSIGKPQRSINTSLEETEICIKGRHDPCILPRVVVVVESMTAITILDYILLNLASNIENIKKIY